MPHTWRPWFELVKGCRTANTRCFKTTTGLEMTPRMTSRILSADEMLGRINQRPVPMVTAIQRPTVTAGAVRAPRGTAPGGAARDAAGPMPKAPTMVTPMILPRPVKKPPRIKQNMFPGTLTLCILQLERLRSERPRDAIPPLFRASRGIRSSAFFGLACSSLARQGFDELAHQLDDRRFVLP